jgi:hypothetical protein
MVMQLDLMQTNLNGSIGAILCWYMDTDNMPFVVDNEGCEPGEERTDAQLKSDQKSVNASADKEQKRIGQLVGLIPKIAREEYEGLGSGVLWEFYDALGSYGPDPESDHVIDKMLIQIYKSVSKAYSEALRREKDAA